ncbi:MAG: DUF721 domain-containing protein [Proteobacteria bacterium]|nr:DUF721 domain-containing protein [Pseudomonadota bacterium]
MSHLSPPIQELLKKPDSKLSQLVSQAQAIEALQQLFISLLNTELIPYCRVGCYESGVLTLFTPNAAIATRLRFEIPTLTSQLRAYPTWAGLCSIQVKVQKNWQLPQPALESNNPKEPPLTLSGGNVEQIQALIDSLKEKPGMEKIIESLQRILRNS